MVRAAAGPRPASPVRPMMPPPERRCTAARGAFRKTVAGARTCSGGDCQWAVRDSAGQGHSRTPQRRAMMLTTRFVNGAPNWIDVGTPDIDGAISFYGGSSAGSSSRRAPTPAATASSSWTGRPWRAACRPPRSQGPPSWTVYFQTPDADATAKAAEQAAAARARASPWTSWARAAWRSSPTRRAPSFGIWQPGRTKGLEVAGDPGSLCWVELYTPDIAAAAAFYDASLGPGDLGGALPRRHVHVRQPGGGRGRRACSAASSPLADDPAGSGRPHWLPYFEVADTDATVTKAQELAARSHAGHGHGGRRPHRHSSPTRTGHASR